MLGRPDMKGLSHTCRRRANSFSGMVVTCPSGPATDARLLHSCPAGPHALLRCSLHPLSKTFYRFFMNPPVLAALPPACCNDPLDSQQADPVGGSDPLTQASRSSTDGTRDD